MVTIWKDEQGRLKKSRREESRDSKGTWIVETYIETLRRVGTPLISTTEDDKGNMVKTTLIEYADKEGGKIINKIVEHLDNSSQNGEDDIMPPTDVIAESSKDYGLTKDHEQETASPSADTTSPKTDFTETDEENPDQGGESNIAAYDSKDTPVKDQQLGDNDDNYEDDPESGNT